MADLTSRNELAETPADGDLVHIVDVSDTTDSASGSSKKITRANLVGGLQATPAEGAFVDGDKTKLDGIETNATADQTGAEIKTAYEAEANTNAYTDAEKTKLAGIETSADVTDSANVTTALASITIDALSGVDTDKSKTPADGDVLTFDGTDWNAEAAAGGGGGNPHDADLVIGTGGDYATLSAAITATAISDGDVIFIKPESITESSFTFTNNDCTIIGAGLGSILLAEGATILQFNGSRNRIKNLTFRNNASTGGEFHFGGTYTIVEEVFFDLQGVTDETIWVESSYQTIQNSRIYVSDSTQSADFLFPTTSSNYFRFLNNQVMGYFTRSGGAIFSQGDKQIWAGNTFTPVSTVTGEILVISGTENLITGNTFNNMGSSGTAIEVSASNNSIVGNYIHQSGVESINLQNVDNCLVQGNYCYPTAGDGIRSFSGNNHHITGNYIYGTTGIDGIILADSGGSDDYNSITNNMIVNCGVGVEFSAATNDFNFLHGNFYRNCTVDTQNTGGANNTISDNHSA